MKRLAGALCLFGVLALSLVAVPRCVQAADLDQAQTDSLTAAIAQGQSYAQIIALAKLSNMPQDAVVQFLCSNAGNDPAKVAEIIDAALAAGYDAESVAFGALTAGASLTVVVNAGKAANADAGAFDRAAARKGYNPSEIASANAGIFVGSPNSGGPGGGGTPGGGAPGGGDQQGGNPLGGGSGDIGGGGGGGNASPH